MDLVNVLYLVCVCWREGRTCFVVPRGARAANLRASPGVTAATAADDAANGVCIVSLSLLMLAPSAFHDPTFADSQ